MATSKARLEGVATRRAERAAKASVKAALEAEVKRAREAAAAKKGDPVALRQERQANYREKQSQAAYLLARLWRLRQARERGFAVGLEEPSWDDRLALLRALIHEETLLSAASVSLQGPGSPPQGVALVAEAAEAAVGRRRKPPTAGLSTLHITVPEKSASTTPAGKRPATKGKGSATKKRNGRASDKGNGH
jgi:hypothetical protein